MSDIWSSVPTGTIVDEDIIRLALADELIVDEFDKAFVKQACYELRASSIFYEVQSPAENKRIVLEAGSGYLLRPHSYVVSIVRERIRLPANVLGRILVKGRLFSIGILPINTYADPGFEGRLGITLYNASHRYIFLEPGEPIAKIEFSVLPKPVNRPYSGQHGYEYRDLASRGSHVYRAEPIRALQKESAQSNRNSSISHGPIISRLARQLRFYRYGVWMQLLFIAVGFVIIFALYGQLSFFGSVSIGIISNLLTTLLVNIISDKVK